MASFVKLDAGILNSTLWGDYDARQLFITALLMAEPYEVRKPEQVIEVDSLKPMGWDVPPGWYGRVEAAGSGIIHRCGLSYEAGIPALKRLASPEPESRSRDFEGRRLARVDGGYLVLNFIKYRERDYGNAERCKRWRERVKSSRSPHMTRMSDVATCHVNMQAEAEAEAEAEREGERPLAQEVDKTERERQELESLGAKTTKDGVDIMSEWKAATKGLGLKRLRSIFRDATPGIQWPSELKAHRAQRQM
jgi:hypothetical protein